MVAKGTYYEHIIISKTIKLIGENASTTIIDGNGTGTAALVNASNVTIRDFTIRGSGPYSPYTGILLVNSNYSKVEKNIIVNNAWGIRLENSSHTQIKFNNIANSTDMDGIYIYQSVNNSIVDNNITNNRYGIFLCESGNNTIINNNVISNRYWGIQIFGLEANYNLIANNTISNNGFTHSAGLDGLYIELSSSNEVVNNTLSMNARDGILLSRSSNNKIRSNKLLNHTGRAGILLSGWEDRNSTNNLIIENSLVGNEYGIYLDSSNDNFIYHNNFINNTRQVLCRYGSETNIWDDVYPSGGNYWSDYTGVDFYSGPYQNETGNDGIGDTPYVIDENNIDHYPLMNSTSVPILLGEVRILKPEDGFVAVGSVDITFSIINIGDPVEFKKGDAHNRIDLEIEFIDKAFVVQVWSTLFDGLTLDLGQALTKTVTYDATFQEVYGDVIIRIVHWKYNPGTDAYEFGEFGIHEIRGTSLPPLSVSISPLSASILIGQSVTFTSTVSGGYTPYTYQWYLNGVPVSDATSSTWTFILTRAGVYYVYLKVTDAKGNTAQSETARITAAAVPVGGYSITIPRQATAKPLTPYLILTAALTIAFTTIKRKTTKKQMMNVSVVKVNPE